MTEEKAPSESQPANRGRWQLRLMLLITVVPLVAAYIAYFTGWGVPGSTVNKGDLLSPVLDVKPLLEDSGSGVPGFGSDTKWRLFIPVTEGCSEACQQNLYVTRQVHIRLGDKSERVERYALAIGDAATAYLDTIQSEHPKLKTLPVSSEIWYDWQAGSGLAEQPNGHFYFLVDPQGFAMLKYSDEHTGNELLKDIKRILRFAPE